MVPQVRPFQALLLELEDESCWSRAETVGHERPYRLQHMLSRAVWAEQQVVERAAGLAIGHLDDGEAILIIDQTDDANSSTNAVGQPANTGALRGSLSAVAPLQSLRPRDLGTWPSRASISGSIPALHTRSSPLTRVSHCLTVRTSPIRRSPPTLNSASSSMPRRGRPSSRTRRVRRLIS